MAGSRTALTALAMLALAGCGGSDDDGGEGRPATPAQSQTQSGDPASAPTPAVPADPDEDAARAGAEASPEAPAAGGGETSELAEGDREAVEAAVRAYVGALNAGDGAAACAAFRPGGIPLAELPVRRRGCAASLGASIGHRRGGGRPAWKRTEIATVDAVSVGGDTARVTATVNHEFSDRKYSSVEEDVVYLERSGDHWLIVKPSATLYRAVGYPEPPLRAFTPPR